MSDPVAERDALFAELRKPSETVMLMREARRLMDTLLVSRNKWRGFALFELGFILFELAQKAFR